MDDFQRQAAETSLLEMFNKSYFDICTVDRVAALMGISVRGSPDYMALHALHCVDYSRMPPKLKEELPRRVASVLGIPPFDLTPLRQISTPATVVDMEPETKRSGFMRLLGAK